jgi:hypothetical protein
MGFFRDLAASIIANTPVEQFLFSPPDKAKYLKELSEQMPSDADIKRQQAPRSLKADEAVSASANQAEKSERQRKKANRKNLTMKLSSAFHKMLTNKSRTENANSLEKANNKGKRRGVLPHRSPPSRRLRA